MGLDDIYVDLRSNILSRDPLPSVKSAFSIVSREESHRNVNDKKNLCFEIIGYPPRNNNMKCTKCGLTNHTVDKCFKVVGYPPNFKRRSFNQQTNSKSYNVVSEGNATTSSTSTSNVSITNEQLSRLLCLLDDKKIGSSTVSNMSDSGANQHMTSNEENLEKVVDVKDLNLTVNHPNGTKAKISKIGDLRLTKDFVLHDVLIVPEYYISLLSMYCIAKDDDLLVSFDKNKCYIQDLKAMKTVVTVWHDKLGHPADQVLHVLKNDLNLQGFNSHEPCEICHKAKQTREPFPLSEHKSTDVGQLIHLDVARALMFQGGIPLDLWGECVLTATYLINRLPSSILSGKCPYELVYNKKPCLSHLRVFGCLAFATILDSKDKFGSRSEKCALIGYSNQKKGYKLFGFDK
ncbi:uncharacterized protein [Rutidosis leptorrhynchoides]|uniref:uncharacterized protein n=1 Tax=Rutidosis leptorrhynchoides TaxID=125765 RepID=UPI003A9A19F0